MPERLYLLVDCHALLYRGHFAMRSSPLRAADGTETSGLFFLVRQMLDRRESRCPDVAAAVFDHPSPVFRMDIYPDYKANRPPMPDDLQKQLEYARRLLPALGFPTLEMKGLEADDIIAWLAVQAESEGAAVEILSSDKDLLQLVSDAVRVIRPGIREGQERIVSAGDVEEIMGVRAEQVADLLALTGDSSDNIPGARGIGPKTARRLLRDYGSIERIYNSIDEIGPDSVRRNLIKGKDLVHLSRELVSLKPPQPLETRPRDLSMKPVDAAKARRLLTELGMRSILERLELVTDDDLFAGMNAGEAAQRCSTTVAWTPAQLDAAARHFRSAEQLALDTETTSRDPFSADPVGLSLASDPDSAWYIPLAGPDAQERRSVTRMLAGILKNASIIAQNARYDMHVMDRLGLRIENLAGDPMIADYLLRPEVQSHSLSALASKWMDRILPEYREVLGGAESLAHVPTAEVAAYCCSDSTAAFALAGILRSELEKDESLLNIYDNLELPLVRVIADMEARGVRLDTAALRALESEFSESIAELETKASETAGCEVNLSSPRQVSEILFEHLGLTPVRKTPGGADSSSMEVLEKLRGEHEFVNIVIEHRELSKLLNTYVRKLPGYVCGHDGLVHTSFHQTVTATGRLSSSNPNLQNIPVRTSRGREVRRCFVPAVEGHVFVTADYSQIELRILAHLAGPGSLRDAYRENIDIHSRTSEAVFGDSTPEYRRKAKEINFSILYGISPWGLSNRINISRGEASEIIERYTEAYPEVASFFSECVEFVEKHGETRTVLGRRRSFPGFEAAGGARRNSMERMAVNTTIQGSAADMIKLAMLRVDGRLQGIDGAGLVLQVHDELVATAPPEAADEVAAALREEMESAFELEVPVSVETGTGADWLEAGH